MSAPMSHQFPPKSSTSSMIAKCFNRLLMAAIAGWIGVLLSGCGTTTTGIATEQMLISDAVDQAIGQIEFTAISGKKVYLETMYYKSVKGTGFVNADYITSSLRQRLTAARCYLQENRDDAEIVVEPRVGALGTDGHEVIFGIQQNSALTTAASAFSNVPAPTIPEISIGKVNAKSGVAKLIVFAYDRTTREPIWQSGIAKAESTSRDTWMFGAGPFQKGSIHEVTKFAGEEITPPQFQKIVFDPPFKKLESPFTPFRLPGSESEPPPISQSPSTPVNISDRPPRQTVPVQNEHYFIRDPATQPASRQQPVNEPNESSEGDSSPEAR